MCDCEDMASIRDQKIAEFFQTVFKSHEDEAGNVSYDKLEAILRSLGKRLSQERLERIRMKFDKEDTGVIDLSDPEFIMTVASLNVVDVKAIDDSVLSSAFKIFDMDSDGRISLHEMRIVLSLFLPVQVQQEQEVVESTIYTMDTARDGEISYTDFVKGVRDSDSFKLTKYKEEILLTVLMVAGFVLYQLLSQLGVLPVIGFYEGPLGA